MMAFWLGSLELIFCFSVTKPAIRMKTNPRKAASEKPPILTILSSRRVLTRLQPLQPKADYGNRKFEPFQAEDP